MDFNPLQITLISLFCLSLLIQLAYYWGIFARLAFYKRKPKELKDFPPVSIVMAARNEYHHLHKNLSALLNQDYPDFEVIVVNHASDDETADYLKEMQHRYSHLKVVTIERDLNFFHGKKFPLSIGIKSAANEILLLTDADCKPVSKKWIQTIAAHYDHSTEIVLAYGPYQKEKGLLNTMIRYDTTMVAMQYLSYALAGMPYMGVGRNLSYRKSLFFKHKGFISHYGVASGDDDLFINQAATAKNTSIEVSPDSFVYSEPKHGWSEWFRQKKRHLSSSKEYKPLFKMLLGGYHLSLALFYLSLFSLLFVPAYTLLVIALSGFILRFITQIILHYKILKRLHEPQLFLFSLFWEPVYTLQLAVMGIIGLTSKSTKWK